MNPQAHLMAGFFGAALIGFIHSKETRLKYGSLVFFGFLSGLLLDIDVIPGVIISLVNNGEIVMNEIWAFHTIYTHNLLFMIPAIAYLLYSLIKYDKESKGMQILQIICIGILVHLLLDWIDMWILPFSPWSDTRWGLVLPEFPPGAPTLHEYFQLNGWGFAFYRFIPVYEWYVVIGFAVPTLILMIWRSKLPIIFSKK